MLESYSLDRYYSEKLLLLLGSFPIIGEVIQEGPQDLKQIFQFCKFFKYLPREEIIGRGRYNPWIYFVLNGECLLIDDNDHNKTLEVIQTGQMFGEMDTVLDASGQKNVIADPSAQEVILLGINSSIYTAQTTIRLLDNSTRISLFQALFRSLLMRYKLLSKKLNDISDKIDIAEFEPLAFNSERDSNDQIVFFDIETKKLALVLNQLREQLYEFVINGDQAIPEINTFITNQSFDKASVYAFTYELPYKLRSTKQEQDSTEDEEVQAELEESSEKSVYTIQELSFLVVDDDDHHRNSAVNVLKDLGAGKIYVEKDGQAAWDFICEQPTSVDVILCDWIMPQMTGLDLYNRIQSKGENLQRIVFIMLTSIESKTSVLEAVENGVHGYVIKPVSQKYILKQIQQALKHVRGAVLNV